MMIDSSEKTGRVRENINALGRPKDDVVAELWHRVAMRIISEYIEPQQLVAAYRKRFDTAGDTACNGGIKS